MSLSLESLWKAARDEEIIDAIGRWESTNAESQRALIAEVQRRGLNIAVPEVTVRETTQASHAASPITGKVMLIMAAIIAVVIAVAYVVG